MPVLTQIWDPRLNVFVPRHLGTVQAPRGGAGWARSLLTPPRPSLDTPWLPLLQRKPALRGTWKRLPHILTQRCGREPGQPLWGGMPQAYPPLQGPLGTSSATEALGLLDHSPGAQRLSPGRWLPGSRWRLALPALPGASWPQRPPARPSTPAIVPAGCCAVWRPLSSLRSTGWGNFLGEARSPVRMQRGWVGLTGPDHPWLGGAGSSPCVLALEGPPLLTVPGRSR